MKQTIILTLAVLVAAIFISCKNNSSCCKSTDWINQGNIYEVNTRQYTPEGTFNAFAKHLDRLKKMGVQTLWFMPINPISKLDRKRDTSQLGSYYAVSDYKAINPEYGNLDDWKNLVKQAHSMGFKVIIDWVANHTGSDNKWMTTHPDFYKKDSTGKVISPFDWTDTKKLDYDNKALQDSMIECMKYWITESDIDGFRCDVAGQVPATFWKRCIAELRKVKNVFMLAEDDNAEIYANAGFDAAYTWGIFSTMKDVVAKKVDALKLDSVINKEIATYPKNAIRMYFTSNHDENSWNKADFQTMPGESHAPFAVLTQTLWNSVPLIYSGQEEPFLDSLKFFVKDTITFGKFLREPFYNKLLHLRTNNEALSAKAEYKKLVSSNDKNIFAFVRQNKNKKIFVVVNLNDAAQKFTIDNELLKGNAVELFTEEKINFDKIFDKEMQPWGYQVFEFKN